jgi:hypothetical protein
MSIQTADVSWPARRIAFRAFLLAFGLMGLSSHSASWAQSTHIQCQAKYDDHPNYWIYYEVLANPPDDENQAFFKKMRDGFYSAISENPPAEVEGLGRAEMECGFTNSPTRKVGPVVNGHSATTTFVRTNFLREGLGYVPTGKEGPKPYRREVGQAPPAPTLVIEKVGPTLEEAAADRAKWSMEIVRRDAAVRAKMATEKAQSDAKYKEMLVKIRAEIRKRGNAQ